MKRETLLYAIGGISDQYIAEAAPEAKKKKKPLWIKWGAAAACLSLAVLGATLLFNEPASDFDLTRSTGNVSVQYVTADEIPEGAHTSGILAEIPEDELFTMYEIIAFKGTVQSVDNILIEFESGEALLYYSVANLQVEKVYKGDIEENSTLKVLIPYPFSDGIDISNNDTVKQLEVGMTGIFTPKVSNPTDDFHQWGENKIVFADIAPYRFTDGTRWMFLDTDEGLLFDRHSYNGAANAETLDDIEEYVNTMLSDE